MKQINWKDHLVNLVVVILGISIAFYLESWKESRSNQRLEAKYLTSLEEDLQQDKAYLDTLIKINKEQLRVLGILSSASVHRPYPKDSLIYYIYSIQYSLPFTSQNTTYESMKFSGKLEVIRDFKLRNDIVELYEKYYRGARQYDEAVSSHVSSYIQPYSIENIVHTGPQTMQDDFITDNQFRNMIFSYQTLAKARLSFYERIKQELQKTLTLVKKNNR